jgi:hypothetical protein
MGKVQCPERRGSLSARVLAVAWLALAWLVACSTAPSPTESSITASEVSINRGVPDRGMDPAVVVVEVLGGSPCTGVLIAPDVVLTARHCTVVVAPHASCPAEGPQVLAGRDPASMRVLLGDEVSSAIVAAGGLSLVAPSTDVLCGADIAFLLLDRPIKSVTAAPVQAVGIANGQHARTVLYGNPPGVKFLREHVPVVATDPFEFRVGEATCLGGGGGPAFDEETGQVVGVLSRFGASCEGSSQYDVYTRTDVFYPLVEQALSSSMEAGKKLSDTSKKDPTDFGGACLTGSDCGAGVCVLDGLSQYCSRFCASSDRCPTDYTCVGGAGLTPFCAETAAK